MLHFACCFNEAMADLLPVLVTSIAHNAKLDLPITIHALHEGAVEAPARTIRRLAQANPKWPAIVVNWIDMSSRQVDIFGDERSPTWWRLALPEVLPDVDRVIYVDMDMVVLGDLSHLRDLDLKGTPVAGAPDWYAVAKSAETAQVPYKGGTQSFVWYLETIIRLPRDRVSEYTNAGFLVLDLDALRREGWDMALIATARDEGRNFPFLDQSTINRVLAGRIRQLPLSYNVFDNKRSSGRRVTSKFQDEFRRASDQPLILHFAGTKPWDRPWRGRGMAFWQYAALAGVEATFATKAELAIAEKTPRRLAPMYRVASRMFMARGLATGTKRLAT